MPRRNRAADADGGRRKIHSAATAPTKRLWLRLCVADVPRKRTVASPTSESCYSHEILQSCFLKSFCPERCMTRLWRL